MDKEQITNTPVTTPATKFEHDTPQVLSPSDFKIQSQSIEMDSIEKMDSKDDMLVKHIGEKKKRVKKENVKEEEKKAEEIDPKGELPGQT